MTTKLPTIYDYSVGQLLAHWRDAILWDPLAAFTVVLAVSTVGLWIATWKLWRGAEQQAKDLTRSACAAETSASAARLTAEMLQHQMRAFINLDSAEMTSFQLGQRPRARVSLRNAGQTAALNVSSLGGIVLCQRGARALVPAPDFTEAPKYSVGPNGTFEINAIGSAVVTQADINAAAQGNLVAYVSVHVPYDDVFGATHKLEMVSESTALGADVRLRASSPANVLFQT